MFDESRYRAGAGGSARKPSRSAAEPARVSQVFVIGANSSTLGVVDSLNGESISAQLLPLAWTPLGIVIGEGRQQVSIARSGLVDWMDRTFPPDDERAFVVPVRDLELLARAGWESAFPAQLNEESILNADDLPDEMAEAFARTPAPLVQCAACRRLCVRDDFVWKEKQLCAWDYHGQAFGKRGPWRETPYESRHFETLASCAYVAPELLEDLNVEALLNVAGLDESTMQAVVNTLLEHDGSRSHMAVRTRDGVVVLREK